MVPKKKKTTNNHICRIKISVKIYYTMNFFGISDKKGIVMLLFISFVYYLNHNTSFQSDYFGGMNKFVSYNFAQTPVTILGESPQNFSHFTALQFSDALNGLPFCQRSDQFLRFQDVNWRGSGFKHKQADFLGACQLAIKLNRQFDGLISHVFRNIF